MASPRTLLMIDRVAWGLVYGGLFAFILGIATSDADTTTGWSLGIIGGVAVTAGIILIWVRSRLHPTPATERTKETPNRGQP